LVGRVGYHRRVIPRRERLVQLARLAGVDEFERRFGPPQKAEPDGAALRALVDERLDRIARTLVEEAAASDDVTDRAGAESYLDDRLAVLGELLTAEQGERLRSAFREGTAAW